MKGPKNTITMSGEQMEVFVGARCLADCGSSLAARLPEIVPQLCNTLSMRAVSRMFINNVRIGDTVALVDKKMGYVFRLKMEAHAVCVLEISRNTVPPKDAAQVFYLVNSTKLWQPFANRLAVAA